MKSIKNIIEAIINFIKSIKVPNFIITIFDILKKNWKMVLIILLAVIMMVQCGNIRSLKTDNKRLSNNFYAMCDTADVYRTKTGQLATKTKNLEVTLAELEALYDVSKQTTKDLNIKLSKLQSYQRGTITKEIHDTITLRDTIIDSSYSKTGVWTDGCSEMTFEVSNKTLYFDLNQKDIIDIYITSEKTGLWWKFWTWPRETIYTTTATSLCPGTKVTVNTCEIKK